MRRQLEINLTFDFFEHQLVLTLVGFLFTTILQCKQFSKTEWKRERNTTTAYENRIIKLVTRLLVCRYGDGPPSRPVADARVIVVVIIIITV